MFCCWKKKFYNKRLQITYIINWLIDWLKYIMLIVIINNNNNNNAICWNQIKYQIIKWFMKYNGNNKEFIVWNKKKNSKLFLFKE